MHIKIHYPRPQIPNKIAGGKALHHAARARIPPQTLARGHDLPLMIQHEHDDGERVDDARLHQRDHMRVPGDFGPGPQAGVDGGEKVGGEARGDGDVDGVVEEEGEEDLVGVLRESVQGETGGEGLG